MSQSYIEVLEDVALEVSQWAEEFTDNIIEAVSPDKRPFDSVPTSETDDLNKYLEIRGNPNAWIQWIGLQEYSITNQLYSAQVPDDEIALISPRKLAEAYALAYSAKMEKLLVKKLSNEPTDGGDNSTPSSEALRGLGARDSGPNDSYSATRV